MIRQASKTNIQKLNRYYNDKRFMEQKHFNALNNSIVLFNDEINNKRFENKKSPIAGTVIESGFMNWKWEFISNNWFKNSYKEFPYSKINKWTKKNKNLKPRWMSKLYFRLSETKSFICFAGAGSGKTSGIVLPTIIANALSPTKPNLLITDPKGELAKSTIEFLKEKGYAVKVLNILDEQNTDCFSPFTMLKEYIYEMLQFPLDASNLTSEVQLKKLSSVEKVDIELENVISSLNEKEGQSDQSFWNSSATLAIHSMAWLIIDDLSYEFHKWINENRDKDEQTKKTKFYQIFIKLSFQSINSTLSQFGGDGINKYINFYKEKFNVDINDAPNSFIREHPGLKQFKQLWRQEGNKTITMDVIQNAAIMLKKFENALLKNLTLFNTFHLDDLYGDKEQPFALFVTINNSQPETLDYVSWFINYVLMKLNSYAVSGSRTKLKKPLMCILEEIGNVPYIKALPITVNEGRGKNIFVSLFFQTYEQYQQKYQRNNSGGDFARSCAYRLILTNAEGNYTKELVNYAGTYKKLVNKQTNEYKDTSRLTMNDVYSLETFKAFVFQNEINVPYLSGLVPYFLLGLKSVDRLDIKIDTSLYNQLHLIYNPLSNKSDWTLDDAIAIDFDLKTMQGIWDLSEEKRENVIQSLEQMKLLETDNNKLAKWDEYIEKTRAIDFDNVIDENNDDEISLDFKENNAFASDIQKIINNPNQFKPTEEKNELSELTIDKTLDTLVENPNLIQQEMQETKPNTSVFIQEQTQEKPKPQPKKSKTSKQDYVEVTLKKKSANGEDEVYKFKIKNTDGVIPIKYDLLTELFIFKKNQNMKAKEISVLDNFKYSPKEQKRRIIDLHNFDNNANKNLLYLYHCEDTFELVNSIVPKVKYWYQLPTKIGESKTIYKTLIQRVVEFVYIKEQFRYAYGRDMNKDELMMIKNAINALCIFVGENGPQQMIKSNSGKTTDRRLGYLNKLTFDVVDFVWKLERIRALGCAPFSTKNKEQIIQNFKDESYFKMIENEFSFDRELVYKLRKLVLAMDQKYHQQPKQPYQKQEEEVCVEKN